MTRQRIQEIFKTNVTGYYPLNTIANIIDHEIGDDPPPEQVSLIKSIVQGQALDAVINNNGWGLCAMATGTGKSKVAINYANIVINLRLSAKILIIVPTEKLRDENWKDEFTKWEVESMWESNIERSCYASIAKLEGNEYDLVICDEGHNITEANSVFFKNNTIHRCIALTATVPQDDERMKLLEDIGLPVVYEVPLDVAVKLRMVAPYDIIVVETMLDRVNKNIVAGTKAKPFMTTEYGNHDYLNKACNKLMFSSDPNSKVALKYKVLARRRFIASLPSKTEAARTIINMLPQDERTLIFCGSIEQADFLAVKIGDDIPQTFHSKSGDQMLNAFKRGDINTITCVNSLNEGHNIDNLDNGVVVQVDSKEKNLIQRIGRLIRYRPGHRARVIIFCAVETKDKEWLQKSMGSLDKRNITYVRYENIVNGSYKL